MSQDEVIINAFAGSATGVPGASPDGESNLTTLMDNPMGVWAEDQAYQTNVYYADSQNYVFRKLDKNGFMTTIAGILGTPGTGGTDGTPATTFTFSTPTDIWGNNAGTIYMVDSTLCAVYRITQSNGLCYLFAGGNGAGYTGDTGAATSAQLSSPSSVWGDGLGNVYIADTANNVIRVVDPFGTINTFAGTGVAGNTGDGGAATSATLNAPKNVLVNYDSTLLYISELNDIRVINLSTNTITTFAGSATAGFSGDGGPATAALLDNPRGLAIDYVNNIVVADSNNHVYRIIIDAGTINRFAGIGTPGTTGNGGLATLAEFNYPYGISQWNSVWYVSDQVSNNIRAISHISVPCFKKDTKILVLKEGKPSYLPIQDLRKGDLIKTFRNDYVPIHMIGSSPFYNPGHEERIKARLYKLSVDKYPTLTKDLIMTGCHSVLVDDFLEGQREKTKDVLGTIFVTDKKYRLPCCVDERAEPYMEEGWHTIYHFALEHKDIYMNYGVFANGLLVETCSKRYMTELSNMTELL